jgi:hypothetical protein
MEVKVSGLAVNTNEIKRVIPSNEGKYIMALV